MKINILGHKYEVIVIKEKDIPKELEAKLEDNTGLCENFSQELIVVDCKQQPKNYKRLDLLMEKVGVHELLYAYLFKSGIHQMINTQEQEILVDFLAINLDNIYENAQKIVKYIGEETK
jgi:hypothetical protein